MSLTAYQYHLPFKKKLDTSSKTFAYRKGIVLVYQTSSGKKIFGEIAPLPGFSKNSLDKIETELQEHVDIIIETLKSSSPVVELQKMYDKFTFSPSLTFGLDTIAYQTTALDKGINMADILFSTYNETVPVNTLGNLLSENVCTEVHQLTRKGFKTIKFKVGRSIETEYQQLREIRSTFPELTIRLDANRAWTLEEAITNCKLFSPLDIEYLEEPLKRATTQMYKELFQATNLPLGIDETIIKDDFWPDILPFTSHVIIKPMVLGNFKKIFATNTLANTHDNKTVYTTSLESGIGRIVTALFASGLGSNQSAHGLTTGSLLDRDLIYDSNNIFNGVYQLPFKDIPFSIDSHILEQLSQIKLWK
ncbi:o-succinylbenzoate synthase [Fodinibius saliphilus]|uniref:o-succinylbenzoate synthase n=1 Tax=Fodinibius saliphilus TaxID=1920650 RepID=UPI0011092D29|nr:o-succinylbenzoate synthase [Fodinibius saliphilus]